MSIFHCERCDRTKDSDLEGYNWIDDLDCAYCDECYDDLCEMVQQSDRGDYLRDLQQDDMEWERMKNES